MCRGLSHAKDDLGAKKSIYSLITPRCQICEYHFIEGDLVYDCPISLLRGSWAHVCKDCAESCGRPSSGTVHKFERAMLP